MSCLCQLTFQHISRSTSGMEDALAKQKADRLINFSTHKSNVVGR